RGDGRVIELTRPNGERINISAELGEGYDAPLGTSHLVYVVRDRHGYSPSCPGFDVPVVDRTPPVVTGCPPSLTLEATGPGGAHATCPPPTAVDAVDGTLALPDALPIWRGDGRVIELTRPNGERINISAELGEGYDAPLGTSHLVY